MSEIQIFISCLFGVATGIVAVYWLLKQVLVVPEEPVKVSRQRGTTPGYSGKISGPISGPGGNGHRGSTGSDD